MTSFIDPRYPMAVSATTESVRQNFQYAKDEITALQAATSAFDPTVIASINGVLTSINNVLTSIGSVITVLTSAVAVSPQTRGAFGGTLTVPSTVAETLLAVVTIPPGSLGLNGVLTAQHMWTMTTTGANKTVRVRYGVTPDLTGTLFRAQVLTSLGFTNDMTYIQNANSLSAQKGSYSGLSSGTVFGNGLQAVLPSGTIDTSMVTYVVFSGQKVSAADDLTLQRYWVTTQRSP